MRGADPKYFGGWPFLTPGLATIPEARTCGTGMALIHLDPKRQDEIEEWLDELLDEGVASSSRIEMARIDVRKGFISERDFWHLDLVSMLGVKGRLKP